VTLVALDTIIVLAYLLTYVHFTAMTMCFHFFTCGAFLLQKLKLVQVLVSSTTVANCLMLQYMTHDYVKYICNVKYTSRIASVFLQFNQPIFQITACRVNPKIQILRFYRLGCSSVTQHRIGLDWAVFYVPTNTVYGRRFLQVKRPNQQYQSTEGTYSKQANQTYNKQT